MIKKQVKIRSLGSEAFGLLIMKETNKAVHKLRMYLTGQMDKNLPICSLGDFKIFEDGYPLKKSGAKEHLKMHGIFFVAPLHNHSADQYTLWGISKGEWTKITVRIEHKHPRYVVKAIETAKISTAELLSITDDPTNGQSGIQTILAELAEYVLENGLKNRQELVLEVTTMSGLLTAMHDFVAK